jgi:hypothetical protein
MMAARDFFNQLDLESVTESMRSAPLSNKRKAMVAVMVAAYFATELADAIGKDIRRDAREVADIITAAFRSRPS